MARKKFKDGDISNPFTQYGERSKIDRLIQFGEPTTPGDPWSFDIPPHIDRWLDAIDAADNGDKSALVALMKSGRPLPGVIIPHIGDLIDRWNLVRPKHRMRVPSHRLTDEDVALNAASCDVDDLVSSGKSISDALTEVVMNATSCDVDDLVHSGTVRSRHHAGLQPNHPARRDRPAG